MELKYDIEFDLATGTSATCKVWKNMRMAWSDFVEKVSHPVITMETHDEYMAADVWSGTFSTESI